MSILETKSIVHLSNGNEVHCANTIDEINTDLKERDSVTLVLSKQQGKKCTVSKYQIVHCVPYD